MPAISAVSTRSAAALSQARAATQAPAQKATAATAASTAVDTNDSVSISAETRSELAQGKPFFATPGAEGEATADAARLGKSERRRKAVRIKRLQGRSDSVEAKAKLRTEETTKRNQTQKQRIGDRLDTEASRKTTRGDAQGEKLGSKEERVKGAAAERTELLTEQAQKSGKPIDRKRLDRIGTRVKDESAQKKTRQGAGDTRRLSREEQVKSKGRDRLKALDGRGEARTKQIGASSGKKLSRLEERMKRLDPSKTDDGGEQKIKASATPATGAAATGTAAEASATDAAAPTKTDVI
jgi:hypothetical protein